MTPGVKTLTPAPFVIGAQDAVDAARQEIRWIKSDAINFGDTSPATVISIPENTLVTGVIVEVATAFLGTTPTLSVGVSGATTRHAATTDVTAGTIGFYQTTKAYNYTAKTDLIVTIGGTSLTAGKAYVWVAYRANSAQ